MTIPLEEIVRGVSDLPPLPWTVTQVIRLTDDPNSTVKDLNDTICQDQSMAAKVLRLSNSAYYGFSRRIDTITDAIGVLGFNTIRNLVLAASAYGVLQKEVKGYQIAAGDIWRHSMTCAMCARSIAKHVKYRNPEQAFIAGLLHDIGKVILSVYMVDAYDEITRQVHEKQQSFSAIEGEVLGFTHAIVGAKVAEKWNLPAELVEAIACHHTPLDAEKNPDLTALIHIADAVSLSMGIGLGGDGMYYPFENQVLDRFRLDETDLDMFISEIVELVSEEDVFQLGK